MTDCQAYCQQESRCSVWQYNTNFPNNAPNQCWVGFGLNCALGESGNSVSNVNVAGAQRIMHGDVKVLKDISGMKIYNLVKVNFTLAINQNISLLRCKGMCYSSLSCQYWQFGEGICWLDLPSYSTEEGKYPSNVVQYPLTWTGATQTGPDAAAMTHGEYIVHSCPPSAQPPVEHDIMRSSGDGSLSAAAIAALVAAALVLCCAMAACAYVLHKRGSGSEKRSTRAAKLDDDKDEELLLDKSLNIPPPPPHNVYHFEVEQARAAETVKVLQPPKVQSTAVSYSSPVRIQSTTQVVQGPTVYVSAPPVYARQVDLFDALDKNHDGVVTRQEFEAATRARQAQPVQAFAAQRVQSVPGYQVAPPRLM